MEENITLLPHHLDVVISKYYFSDEWDEQLKLVGEQHGEKMVSHAKNVINRFFDSKEVKIVIERPDSICSPELSTICKRCIASYCIDSYPSHSTLMDLDTDEEDYKKYQLERIEKDEDYKKVRHIRLALNEVLTLLYYDLEPKRYSPKFLISKIEETAIKLGRDYRLARRPSEVGYSCHESIRKYFPDVYKLMESGLVKDFIDRTIDEHIYKRKITSKALHDLRKKYCNLFAAVGYDNFYYETSKIIEK